MDKISEKIYNRFIPVDNEELSALELIGKLISSQNLYVDELNKKTDLIGDHKGTWQGLKPTQTDVGLGGQVDKNTQDIKMLLGLIKYKVDISSLDNFNDDDISTSINSIDFISGYTYYLDVPSCKSKKMIDIILPENTTLIINSFVECYDSFLRLKLGQNCRIDLLHVKASQENIYDRGLHLISGSDSTINIGKIQGFLTSVSYKPLVEWDWIQYMKLNFFDISGDVGLELTVPHDNCWVNENTFNGGGFGGRINIWQHKTFNDTNYRSLINNNKYYNIGLQSKEECILIDKSSGETNYFYNLRTWEQEEYHTGGLYINDNGGSNYFECQHQIQYDKIKLGADSKFDGQLFAPWDVTTNSFPIVCYQAIGSRDTSKPYVKYPILPSVNCDRSSGQFNLSTVCNNLFANMGNAEVFTVYLQTPVFFDNNNFLFRKAGWDNGSAVRLETPTGKSITLTNNGLYYISLSSNIDYFEVIKIGEGEPLTPQ